MLCRFQIKNWAAASDRPHTPEQWQMWASGNAGAADFPKQPPAAAFLPAMQRRRLGLPARLLFEAAHRALDGDTRPCPTVSASYDGEIARSLQLWTELCRDHTVSPTSFGLSVHNAVVGQWSLWRGDMSENTALAVSPDGLETAVLEACALLADGAERVLVIVADAPADAPLHNTVRAPFAYALALLLEHGDTWQLQRTAPDTRPAANGYWSALSWIRHRLLGTSSWTHPYGTHAWHWSIHC
ncbi:beta-ketoacyl synthase chain length factor [Conchiformibius kuhniae]|uniref:Beta-ketoacyl synthase chain length factor n=1 Tax=Conchiformibius kuhniae TaxID=211502 RepID=A0A8T9MW04_9NEIS|nr:beta-ketoacyl synthase chain length factor [Conchiformibius kuhniae]UOP04646.1 beta-ketoacyl synthase chain length factor [Conchiformibius kuhniae]